jgi:hypothetical protein
MTGNVVKIRPTVERVAATEPVPEIIEAAERLLADARAGRVRSLAFATEVHMPEEHSTGCGSFWWRGEGGNAFTLLGGLAYLQGNIADAIG